MSLCLAGLRRVHVLTSFCRVQSSFTSPISKGGRAYGIGIAQRFLKSDHNLSLRYLLIFWYIF